MFAPSPGATIDVIAKYDDKGPAWYWNTIRMGEHTGTHFDAPIHWITGKDLPDNACDTIPVARSIGPACVIEVTDDVSRDPDFLLITDRLEQWEADYGRIPPGAWPCCAADGGDEPTPHRSSTPARTVRTVPGSMRARRNSSPRIATCSASASKRSEPTLARPARSRLPFRIMATMHGAGKFGLASLCNLDQLPPTGAIVIAAPLKIVNGSGSPLRVIAIT